VKSFESYRLTDRHTASTEIKAYSTPLRGWSKIDLSIYDTLDTDAEKQEQLNGLGSLLRLGEIGSVTVHRETADVESKPV